MSPRSSFALAAAMVLSCMFAGRTASATTLTTFDDGLTNGWTANGQQPIASPGGNPGAYLPISINGAFGIDVSNNSDPDVIGNYLAKGSQVKLSIDVDTNSIVIPPTPTQRTRRLIAELVHYNDPGDFYEYYSAHEAWGLGVYCVFKDAPIIADTAIEAPEKPGVRLHHMIAVRLSGIPGSGINRVINDKGDPVITKQTSRLK